MDNFKADKIIEEEIQDVDDEYENLKEMKHHRDFLLFDLPDIYANLW